MLKVRDEAENLQLIIETWHQTELGRKVSTQKLNMRREEISTGEWRFSLPGSALEFQTKKIFFLKHKERFQLLPLLKGDH